MWVWVGVGVGWCVDGGGGCCKRFREGGSLGYKYFWFSMQRYRQELGCDNVMNTTCTANANIAIIIITIIIVVIVIIVIIIIIIIITQSTTAAGVVQIRYYQCCERYY